MNHKSKGKNKVRHVFVEILESQHKMSEKEGTGSPSHTVAGGESSPKKRKKQPNFSEEVLVPSKFKKVKTETPPTKKRLRKARRKIWEVPENELWHCTKGCGKFYKRTSTLSIKKHFNSCDTRKKTDREVHEIQEAWKMISAQKNGEIPHMPEKKVEKQKKERAQTYIPVPISASVRTQEVYEEDLDAERGYEEDEEDEDNQDLDEDSDDSERDSEELDSLESPRDSELSKTRLPEQIPLPELPENPAPGKSDYQILDAAVETAGGVDFQSQISLLLQNHPQLMQMPLTAFISLCQGN